MSVLSSPEAMQGCLKEIAKSLRAGISRPPRTYREFLESCVVIPDGKHRGKRFRVDRQPVIGLFIDAIDSGLFNEYIFTAPSQFGKTLIAFVGPLVFHCCELQENYVLGVPFSDMAGDKWDLDVRPVMKASPQLRQQLPVSGSGSAGGKIRDRVTLSTGVEIKLMSAGADDAGKAGFTSRVLGVTEAARFSMAGGSSVEADPLRQLRARQRSYEEFERVTYVEGTVTIEEELPWALKPISTDSRIMTQCPHCSEWMAPERDDLVGWNSAQSENEAAEKAFWACPKCGQQITEAERANTVRAAKLVHRGQTIKKSGEIDGPPPDTSRLFFRAAAFHNLFLSAGSVAKDEWKALQIPDDSPERFSADRELCQFVHCIPYVDPMMSEDLDLNKSTINKKRLDLPPNLLPHDTKWLTCGCDVGSREIWYLILATRVDENGQYRHVPLYGNIEVPSDQMPIEQALPTALNELASLLDAGFLIEGSEGKRRLCDQEWVDCNFQTDIVHAWVRSRAKQLGREVKRKHQPVVGAYGRGTTQLEAQAYNAPRKKTNTVREIDKHGMWYLEYITRARTAAVYWDSDSSKWQVQQALTLPLWKKLAEPAAKPNAEASELLEKDIAGLQADLMQDGKCQVPGSVTFHSGTSKIHERLARHLTNERIETVKTATGTKRKWVRHGANHLLDCFAMAFRATERAKQIADEILYMPPFVSTDKKPQPKVINTESAKDATKPKKRSWYDGNR